MFANLPLPQRVLELLVILLSDADELLALLDDEEASSFLWIEPHVRAIFAETERMLAKMTD